MDTLVEIVTNDQAERMARKYNAIPAEQLATKWTIRPCVFVPERHRRAYVLNPNNPKGVLIVHQYESPQEYVENLGLFDDGYIEKVHNIDEIYSTPQFQNWQGGSVAFVQPIGFYRTTKQALAEYLQPIKDEDLKEALSWGWPADPCIGESMLEQAPRFAVLTATAADRADAYDEHTVLRNCGFEPVWNFKTRVFKNEFEPRILYAKQNV